MIKPAFLEKVKKVHLTGIKGVGMTALAGCCLDLGIKVTGSDVEEVFVTDRVLRQRSVPWRVGFKKEHLPEDLDLLITTGAHGGLKNPEVLAAKARKIPVLTQAEALGSLMVGKQGISACGVGGKTTTASMLATALVQAGRRPSWAIGVASIDPLGWGGRFDQGEEFVAEADEYVNSVGTDKRIKFTFQDPKIIVCTNIEYDHPDVYPSLAETQKTFASFFEKVKKDGLLVACQDNENIRETVKGFSGQLQTYGFSPQADWQITRIDAVAGQTLFDLAHQGVIIKDISLKVPGGHNVLNAAAVFAVATYLGLSALEIKKGLAAFGGTKRRFEFVGEVGGIKLYDDYAHHPKEIRTVLQAAKTWFPGCRLMVIFQPHTYSRTQALFKEFGRAFFGANQVVITDIYASAREKENSGVSGKLLAEEVGQHQSMVVYQPGEKEVVNYLGKQTKKGDIILTLGAGSIFLWHQNMLKSLKG